MSTHHVQVTVLDFQNGKKSYTQKASSAENSETRDKIMFIQTKNYKELGFDDELDKDKELEITITTDDASCYDEARTYINKDDAIKIIKHLQFVFNLDKDQIKPEKNSDPIKS
jgi:hypothetical protein